MIQLYCRTAPISSPFSCLCNFFNWDSASMAIQNHAWLITASRQKWPPRVKKKICDLSKNQARKNPPHALGCKADNKSKQPYSYFTESVELSRTLGWPRQTPHLGYFTQRFEPLWGGRMNECASWAMAKHNFKENEKGLGAMWVTEQGILLSTHTHTLTKQTRGKRHLSIQQRATWELYSCRASGFSGCCCAPDWSQAGSGGVRGRLLRATCCFFQCAHPSKPIDRGRCDQATERAQQARSHLFLRATNQQSLASSLGSTGNASYKVSHLCSKSKNCCCCRRSRVSERARGESGEGIRLVPCRSQNTTPQGWWGYFFLGVVGSSGSVQAADARRRSLPPPIHAFAGGHTFPILGKATLWAPARSSQRETRASEHSLGCVALSPLDRSIFYLWMRRKSLISLWGNDEWREGNAADLLAERPGPAADCLRPKSLFRVLFFFKGVRKGMQQRHTLWQLWAHFCFCLIF